MNVKAPQNKPIPIFLSEEELNQHLLKFPIARAARIRASLSAFWVRCAEMLPDPKLIVCKECGRVKGKHGFTKPHGYLNGEFALVTVVCPECRGHAI